MKASVIIPARYESTRFPGKPLAKIKNKEMIIHVVERALSAKEVDEVVVATDSVEIEEIVKRNGYRAVITSKAHKSGTDRVAEAAQKSDSEIIVNLQGDEPLIDPAIIDSSIIEMKKNGNFPVCSFKKLITNEDEMNDPNVVKVVTDKNDYALYFSRYPIPYVKEKMSKRRLHFKHIGIYTFRREFLPIFSSLQPSPLEMSESLEQLRIIENGYKIKVIETEYESLSVDTPEDLTTIERFIDKNEN
ncbi:MAG: 3-deoxy-manno-octulosonate cytidylyltransferase [Candidatus Schekmanbacteria bacterium]|nr:MAG: 3-deoxy-manno-octulosonate cytidylyltransferase [Candidatus Schekmanbacteria bacterium]